MKKLMTSFSLALFLLTNIALAKSAHDVHQPSRSPTQESDRNPKFWLEAEMGHRNSEKINFSSRLIEGDTVYVISYLKNDKVLVERAVPKESFTSNIEKLRFALPGPARERLSGIVSCGMPFTMVSETVTGKRTYLLCLDRATTVELQATTRWWKELRELVGI